MTKSTLELLLDKFDLWRGFALEDLCKISLKRRKCYWLEPFKKRNASGQVVVQTLGQVVPPLHFLTEFEPGSIRQLESERDRIESPFVQLVRGN
jgi:hypothetical protein